MDDTPPSVQDAINAALSGNWNHAIEINSILHGEDPTNIDTLNRLGYAFFQINDFENANKTYKKVLSIDKYNAIADKNIKRITSISTSKNQKTTTNKNVSPLTFIEEPGISRTVTCLNTAPFQILSTISSGQEVVLSIKKRSFEIRTHEKIYLGVLPDDLSHQIISRIKDGMTYQACIQSIGKNCLSVLLREKKNS
jgi:hypothetical protein